MQLNKSSMRQYKHHERRGADDDARHQRTSNSTSRALAARNGILFGAYRVSLLFYLTKASDHGDVIHEKLSFFCRFRQEFTTNTACVEPPICAKHTYFTRYSALHNRNRGHALVFRQFLRALGRAMGSRR